MRRVLVPVVAVLVVVHQVDHLLRGDVSGWPFTAEVTLSRLDQAYFDRLRSRVESAGARGIYVSVMLFDGFALHLTRTPDNVRGHPFHAGNNINGVGIGSIRDYQVLPLDPSVQALQEVYLRKVVDTVGDLPNLLYEVANESMAPLSTRGSATRPSGSAG